jgi:hypothetical protein
MNGCVFMSEGSNGVVKCDVDVDVDVDVEVWAGALGLHPIRLLHSPPMDCTSQSALTRQRSVVLAGDMQLMACAWRSTS